jgi:hypothetical protein
MESQALATTSESHSRPSEPQSRSYLLREWVLKFALNAGQALDAMALSAYVALWTDGFSDLPNSVLEAVLRKALHSCKFWPVKLADIREHIEGTKETALVEAADLEWQRVLDLRRDYWNPDFPGGFTSGMPLLSERTQAACRAAGIFREISELNQLHIWGKKRFIESYLAWQALEQDRFLLPDDELKNALSGVANTKALPSRDIPFNDLYKRGLRYAEELKKTSPPPPVSHAAPVHEAPRVIAFEGRAAELQRQAELIQDKYPVGGKERAL